MVYDWKSYIKSLNANKGLGFFGFVSPSEDQQRQPVLVESKLNYKNIQKVSIKKVTADGDQIFII